MNSHYCVWVSAWGDDAFGREYQVNGSLTWKNEMEENLALKHAVNHHN
jgi:hypothetical protein